MFEVLVTLLPVVLYGSMFALFIWSLIDISSRQVANKALWVVVIIGIPLIGSLGYLIGGRKQ